MDKKASKKLYEQQQRGIFENSLPLSRDVFERLFNYLDEALEGGCNDTLSLTEVFLHNEGVRDIDKVLLWLNDNGGYCDCEVLANVEELFD